MDAFGAVALSDDGNGNWSLMHTTAWRPLAGLRTFAWLGIGSIGYAAVIAIKL